MRFGVNLFGAYDCYKDNPDDFFRKMAETGYKYVEPCIALEPLKFELPQFWSEEALEKYVPAYEKAGLSAFTCHALVTNWVNAAEKLITFHEKYGFDRYIICYSCPIEKEAYAGYAEQLMELADEVSKEGIQLLLHNGDDDVKGKIEGISAYEWLIHACQGKIGAEPDTGWLIAGGEDPEAFLWRNKEYIQAVHYKDMKKAEDGSFVETPIGTGLTDMAACYQFSRANEVPQFADQDNSEDMEADIIRVCNLLKSMDQSRPNSRSILCIYDTETCTVTKLREFDKVIEAPNWMLDGEHLIYNSDGLIWKYNIAGDEECQIPSGKCTNCNNDHVLSPDNSEIAISHSDVSWMSQIYIMPIEGGEPRLITPNKPSFLHGWSPDGKELAYCAFRGEPGKFTVDVYTIPSEGGEEKALTSGQGVNDGPEYSPDGEYIWFNSTRTGLMQVWRMKKDGSEQTQMTFEENNNWFGHISPDGKKVVNLAYSKLGLDPNEHLPNMNVSLWMMNADGSEREKILDFFGGQGSINVNSWSPDSKKFAFVMYELIHK